MLGVNRNALIPKNDALRKAQHILQDLGLAMGF
jgi:hypothetical protein